MERKTTLLVFSLASILVISGFSANEKAYAALCFQDLDNDGFGTGSSFENGQDVCGVNQSPIPGDCDDGQVDVSPGATEICDGIDNDCDAQIDEDIASTITSCGLGACASTGVLTCANGDLVDSCIAPPGTNEVCDGIDNDCDGTLDEGFIPTPTFCGVGVCAATGVLACTNGAFVNTCTPGAPSAEVCDGIDNDCDLQVDEDIAPTPTSCGLGACADTGVLACTNGAFVNSCTPGNPGFEVCDGIDNDCDGTLDEGAFLCSDGNLCFMGSCEQDGVEPVGGTYVPIDNTALLLAGVSSVSMWMIPVLIAGVGIGVYVVMRRK